MMNFRSGSIAAVLALIIAFAISTPAGAAVLGAAPQSQMEERRTDVPQARAVLVFENGSRETLDTWDKVLAGLDRDLATFRYNRPGYGKSAATAVPRDGRSIAEALHRELREQGLKPPYLLVGHSLGGLYMQLFARMYPQETQGVVLVDSLYPGVIKRPEDFPLYTRIAKRLFLNETVSREIDQIHNTGDMIDALPWPDEIPMVRLINVPKSAGAIGVDFGVVNADPQTIAAAKAIYPRARKIICDSDHRIQEANPEIVVAAIREVLAQAKARPVLQ